MAVTDIINAAGSALGGLGGLISSIGAGRRQRKLIKAQEASQKRLMDYQHDIAVDDWNRQNAYDEQLRQSQYEKYDSLQAQVKDAMAAGLNPEVVAGGASSGGSSISGQPIGGTSIPGRPDVGPAPASAGEIIANTLSAISGITDAIETTRFNRENRNIQLEAARQKLNEQKVDIFSKLDKLNWSREDRSILREKLETSLNFDLLSLKRGRQAYNFDEEANSLKIQRMKQEIGLNNSKEAREKAIHALQTAIAWEELNEKNWKNWYRTEFGEDPGKSMSLGDVLNTLVMAAVDTITDDTETGLPVWQQGLNSLQKGLTFNPFRKEGAFVDPRTPWFSNPKNESAEFVRRLKKSIPSLNKGYHRSFNPYWPSK